MKTAAVLLNSCGLLAIATLLTENSMVMARPMHAGINYQRYLAEKEAIDDELSSWMDKFGGEAAENGWLPITESRSADEVQEDRKQRFFMAKELVEKLKQDNPDAEFTTDSPFSLLTEEEFAKYIRNEYIASGATRRLREAFGSDDDNVNPMEDVRGRGFSFEDLITNFMKKITDGSGSDGGANGGAGGSFNFMDLITNFMKKWSDDANADDKNTDGSAGIAEEDTDSKGSSADEDSDSNGNNADEIADGDASVGNDDSDSTASNADEDTSGDASVGNDDTGSESAGALTENYEPSTSRRGRRTSQPPSGPVAPVGPVAPTDAPGVTPSPAAGTGVALNGGVDWSTNKCMPPIQNQGQCGDCWAFATVAAVETGKCLTSGTLTKYSEQFVASCDNRNMGCNGGVPVYAYQFIQKNGLCTASDVPYTASSGRLGSCNSGCNKVQVGIKKIGSIRGDSGLTNTLKSHPVLVAVSAGNNAWKQYRSGVITAQQCGNAQVDHAVLAVGYDDSAIKIRNSWGGSWGENGYIRLARSTSGQGTCGVLTDITDVTF
ncbi:hypothetical protein Poli38472_004074 [Pythium oligandrum]|uniref:Peptidase C1A papain C-terminal domain-containing protein n=1 Tax=Pythium oligandrum TaxID=41045 RepID=A0A8K1CMN5_PYTOL|nr:hypothetical protein Poli38472_004074 [Pythium oligandrum]|eukprot:TMW66309.1 hypothetical protein Poli38472_004074 [Pythium oligandrum]